MQISEVYSHLNGLEYLLVHKKHLWTELQEVLSSIHAKECKTKVSKEKTKKGQVLYSPKDINKKFREILSQKD